jgi:hypothetical protein
VAADDLIDACLSELSVQTGLDALSLDEHGCCSFDHSDGFVFTLMAPDGGDLVHLSSRLLDVPASDRQGFYSRLLKLNFLLLETAGASLSIDEDEEGVYLCLALVRASLSAEHLLRVIANFLASSGRLRARLLDSGDDGGASGLTDGTGAGWIAA